MNKISDIYDTNRVEKKIIYFLMLLPSLLFQKSLNNDAWFLLNHGRYVINYGFPHIEPFTIHGNMEFVMQQWLSSLIFWLFYSRLSNFGLYLVIFISYFISILIMFKMTKLISNNNILVSYSITLLFGVFIKLFMETRPMIFTILLTLLELYSLELYIKYDNWRYLTFLPMISLLLINLHAAMWPILFIILVPYIIDSLYINFKIIVGQGYENKYIFVAIILMILIAFANPYGLKAMSYLFTSYGYPEISNMVSEMKSPSINSLFGIIIYFFIGGITFIYLYYRNGKTRVRYILLTLGTLIMVLSSIRSFPFFIICSLFPLAYYLQNTKVNLKLKNEKYNKRLRTVLITAIIIMVVLVLILDIYYTKDETYDNLKDVVNYMLENEKISDVILYTGYNEGGFTEFNGISSYLDPRAEVFVKKNNKKDDIMKEYIDLQNGNIYYRTVLDKYNFTHLLISKGDILNTYLPFDNDYDIIYSNDNYKLFKKINMN